MKGWNLGVFVLGVYLIAGGAQALPIQRFLPFKDTLAAYNILKIPEAAEYPDYPAVGVLSVHEFRQMGTTQVRFSHLILKILSPAGKRYTTMKVPCYTECHVEGRTLKPDGKIINVPGKDLIRNRQFTRYNAPFSYVQFAVPAVEPGDLVEIQTTVLVPVPLFMEDFRFSEPYPVAKAVLLLSHPGDFSYTYFPLSKPGAINVSKQKKIEAGVQYIRTQFVMNNVAAAAPEAFSAGTREEQPGVRFVMIARAGMQFEVFKDWFSYGKFISEHARLEALLPKSIKDFVEQSAGNATAPADIVRAIYKAADQKILIGSETIIDAGLDFTKPEDVLANKSGNPHDFALFLGACFRVLRWSSELVLVNSHDLPATSKEKTFPLDLDLVFLNVKTPEGEFLLDCNNNGLPSGVISSSAMNRFALVIPVLTGSSTIAATPYVSTVPFRAGNANRIDMTWTPDSDFWRIDFRWFLGGELQAKLLSESRQESEAEFVKDLSYFVRTHLRINQVEGLNYAWMAGGLEIRGKGRVSRTKLDPGCELVQNTFWDADFNFRQYLFENRAGAFLLPLAGEISSLVRINLVPGMNPVLPAAQSMEFKPLKYTMAVERSASQVIVTEKITIGDLLVRPASFPGFVDFLDKYYASHFWSVLLLSANDPAKGAM